MVKDNNSGTNTK